MHGKGINYVVEHKPLDFCGQGWCWLYPSEEYWRPGSFWVKTLGFPAPDHQVEPPSSLEEVKESSLLHGGIAKNTGVTESWKHGTATARRCHLALIILRDAEDTWEW